MKPVSVYAGMLAFLITAIAPLSAQVSSPIEQSETFKGSRDSGNSKSRSLRISLTVDSPSHLKVKEGEEIKEGDILADNSLERDRLNGQRKALLMELDNLKKKVVNQPFEPKTIPAISELPKAQFLEEESRIAQAKLRLEQAQSLFQVRSQVLRQENPQRRAETERAESALRLARKAVLQQEEKIKSMQDLKLQASIMRHEAVKLEELNSVAEQANSNYQRELAITENSNTEQNQQLQNLEIAVQLAQSDLQVASSGLEKARSDRKVQEYEFSIKNAQRLEEENRSKQTYSQQQTQYAQALRDREYQLSQLRLQLTAIEDKIAILPTVKSPRSGYIRRVKPWVGNNGKYSTVVTISSANRDSKRKILRGKSDRAISPSPQSSTSQD
jgi:hypothetical protein